MAIKLDKLAQTRADQRAICHYELRAVGNTRYSVQHKGDMIDIHIFNITEETLNGCEVLSMLVAAEKNGKTLELNNPFVFVNPPICVPDGTFENVMINGVETQVSNFIESPHDALKSIVFNTLKATALL